MVPESVIIVDISSDEEDDVLRKSGTKAFNRCSSLDWLDNMLRLDCDPWICSDVQVVDEFSCLCGEEKLAIVPYVAKQGESKDDSDDDCIILDGDPDKPVQAIVGKEDCSDELLIVGEKGQVACRDFPHSRHICVNLPFNSTSHDKYCKMCHCYVCDVPAPCTQWALHCHSSDKEEKWITERRSLRRKRNHPPPTPNPTQNPTQTQNPKPSSIRHRLPPAFRTLISMGNNPSRGPYPPLRHCSAAAQPLPYIPPISSSPSQPDLSSTVPQVPSKRHRTGGYSHHVRQRTMPVPLPLPAPPLPSSRRNSNVPVPQLPHLERSSQLPPTQHNLGTNPYYKPRSYSSSQPSSYV